MPDLTWLITGATGFLGANLGYSLEGHGQRIGVTRSGEAPEGFDTSIQGDLTSPEELATAVIDRRPSVIIHAAALASHEACARDPERAGLVNGRATGLLARAAEETGAHFVYISTDAVFDGERGNYSETDTPRPTSVYGRTKLEGEELCRRETDALIVRANFFGWSKSGNRSILEFFVNELSAGNQVRGFTDFTTTSAYVQVLAEAIRDLVVKKVSGTFHVTSPDALTKYAFGIAVAEEFGLDPGLITPTTADIQPPRNGDISLDVSKVQALLDTPLPTQRAGIQRAHEEARTLRQCIAGLPRA